MNFDMYRGPPRRWTVVLEDHMGFPTNEMLSEIPKHLFCYGNLRIVSVSESPSRSSE